MNLDASFRRYCRSVTNVVSEEELTAFTEGWEAGREALKHEIMEPPFAPAWEKEREAWLLDESPQEEA